MSKDHKDKKRKHSDEATEEVEKKTKVSKKEKKDKKEKKEKVEHSEPEHTLSLALGYVELAELAALPQLDIDAFLKENEVSVDDTQTKLRPLLSFSQVTLNPKVSDALKRFSKPTPIQAVAWPYLLAGKDVIGVAETGSGKTFAFGVPAINAILELKKKGLLVMAISPTRELAMQIYDNLVTLTQGTSIECVAVYGGVSKDDQIKRLRLANVVVATPGRLLDLMNDGAVDLLHIDYLVLDEADRMLEKGFEEDIKKIISSTNSEGRQTLMFTATWPKEVRELAATFMNEPVKVLIGNRDELTANKRITQIVEVLDPRDKERTFFNLLRKYDNGDKILVFALYKKEATRVEGNMRRQGYKVAAIHGDLSQHQRTLALESFKKGENNILLATDVAARGLDIPNVKVVINLTFPLTVEDYVHRIGRTGRAGQTGIAHTLFTEHEKHLSGGLANILRGANQPVPDALLKFGGHTKKKAHLAYGAFYKDVDMTKTAKKIKFD